MHNLSKMVLSFGLVCCVALVGCGGAEKAAKKSAPADQTKSKGQQWMEKADSTLKGQSEGGSKVRMERKEIDVLDSLGRSALHRAALSGNLKEATACLIKAQWSIIFQVLAPLCIMQ